MGMAAVREDFEALRRTLGLDRVAAIGWANGAMNLILLAAEQPEELDSAIFVHGAARYTEQEIEEFPRLHPEVYARVTKFESELASSTISEAEKNARLARFVVEDYFPLLFADPQSGRAMLRDMYRETRFSWSHMAYSSAETRTFDYTDRLPRIRARSLVIAGAHDLLPPEKVRELQTGINGSRFVLFEKSGHFAPIEEAESFKKTLLDFLE
jgi:pimeloyl-ACP methyl ester carboxylesterase